MIFLLSSASSQRYLQDVLRCLAAPVGATLHFRYDRELVSPLIINQGEVLLGRDAFVCFFETEDHDRSSFYPVRKVTITAIQIQGSTCRVTFEVKGFVFAEAATFTKQVRSKAVGTPATMTGGQVTGSYFFMCSDFPSALSEENTLECWEKVVSILSQRPAFADVPFFWAITGLRKIGGFVQEKFDVSDNKLDANSIYRISVYHFDPLKDQSTRYRDPKALITLRVEIGNGMTWNSPQDVKVDSPYDIKEWLFTTGDPQFKPQPNWVRITTSAAAWELRLDLTIKATRRKSIIVTIAIFVLVGVPSVINSTAFNPIAKLALSGASALAVALAIVFGLKKVP